MFKMLILFPAFAIWRMVYGEHTGMESSVATGIFLLIEVLESGSCYPMKEELSSQENESEFHVQTMKDR